MPKFNITSALPVLPNSLTDKDAALVTPLYLAVSNLANNAAIATGNATYTPTEMAQVSQFVNLLGHKIQRVNVLALADLPFGALVNFADNVGKIGGQLADAVLGRYANAICNAPSGIPAGTYGEVIISDGWSKGIAGTTIGKSYYLGTDGLAQDGPRTEVGELNQFIGVGLGADGIYFQATVPAATIVADPNYVQAVALVDIPVGSLINFVAVDGILNAQLADSDLLLPVMGVYDKQLALTAGAIDAFRVAFGVQPSPTVTAPAELLYLGLAGAPTNIAPTAAGKLVQYIGFGLDTENYYFNPEPNGTVVVVINGPLTKTADFTVVDGETWFINDKPAASCVVTLPLASEHPGRELTFKNMQAFPLLSASTDVLPIDSTVAGTTILLGVVGNWASMVSDGTNWAIMQQAPNNILLLE